MTKDKQHELTDEKIISVRIPVMPPCDDSEVFGIADYSLNSLHSDSTRNYVDMSVTRSGDLLDFGQLFKVFGNS